MEYKVVEIREGHAREGWLYKSMTAVDVKGRVGPGGVDGLIVVFERPA